MAAGVTTNPALVDQFGELWSGLDRSRLEGFGKRRHECDLIVIGDQGSGIRDPAVRRGLKAPPYTSARAPNGERGTPSAERRAPET